MAQLSDDYKIRDFYVAYYGRPADPSGLAFWVNGVAHSGDLIGSAISVFGSQTTPEFAMRYPTGTSIETFLTQAYSNLFNRTPEAGGLKFWSDAFRNWTNGGIYSEGEARAQILVNIVDAANGQTGTNDKLSITNKHTVADAMTASVHQYGTETAYVAGLDRAQNLLAAVDHTQASVNAALARIKYGLVDGVDPVFGGPAIPAHVYDLHAYTPSQIFSLSSATEKAILKFSTVQDSPFGWVYASKAGGVINAGPVNGGNTVDGQIDFAALMVMNFDFNVDKIDVSALGLHSKQYTSLGHPWSDSQLVFSYNADTNTFAPSANWKNYDGFFGNAGVAGLQVNTSGGSQTWVFVDANSNGNLDLGTDGWIILAGTVPNSLNSGNFIY